jgi:site-specific recombinase XerD
MNGHSIARRLFCTGQGRPLSKSRLRGIVATVGKRAGIRCDPRRLRHTFALQYLLGHEELTVTREYVNIAAQDASHIYRWPLDAPLDHMQHRCCCCPHRCRATGGTES